jgi:palmitoyl-protein thioesterase
MKYLQTTFILIVSLFSLINSKYPVAIFHGIGDSCDGRGMTKMTKFFSDKLGGVYSKCIESAGGVGDWFSSFISQGKKACEDIKNDPNFDGEFSVVGISQGSLLGGYVIEACEMKGRVKRYVSIGGPQMGVAKFPHCDSGIVCNAINYAIKKGVYSHFVQSSVGPAGYFKANDNIEEYIKYSTFLADLNNEKEEKNPDYKERILGLEKLVLIKFSKDTMILPKETAWFQFLDKEGNVEKLEDSEFYKKDYLGIRQLHNDKKITFVQLVGDHLRFSYSDIEDYMIPALQ